jgi:hypothetical protein
MRKLHDILHIGKMKTIPFVFVLFMVTDCLQKQEFIIPPIIINNVPSESEDYYSVYGFQKVRIWGWSKDGKAAYSAENFLEGRGGQIIDFVILDLIDDKEVFKLSMDSFDYNAIDEELYNLSRFKILIALNKYNIIRQDSDLLYFPFKKNNVLYDCRITNVEYEGELVLGQRVVSRYSVLVTADKKSKIINNFTDGGTGVSVSGYLLSPFENRALVVISERGVEWEGIGYTSYRFSGCHLETGFK